MLPWLCIRCMYDIGTQVIPHHVISSGVIGFTNGTEHTYLKEHTLHGMENNILQWLE